MKKTLKILFFLLIICFVKTNAIEHQKTNSYKLQKSCDKKEIFEEYPNQFAQIDEFTHKHLDKYLPDVLNKIILDYAKMASDYSIKYQCPQIINIPNAIFNNIIQLQNGSLASCSKSGEINLWKPDQGGKYYCYKTITDNSIIFSFSIARNIENLIQLQNGDLVYTFLNGNQIKIWEPNQNGEYSFLQALQYENINSAIQNVIQLQDGSIASCAINDNYPIRIWKLDQNGRYSIFQKISSKNNCYRIIQLQDLSIAVSSCNSESCFIQIYKPNGNNKFVLNQTIAVDYMFDSINSLTQLQNGSLAFCSSDNKIIIYDRDVNGRYKFNQSIDNAHNNHIRSIIQLNEGTLASCCYDNGEIKIWKLDKNGKYYCHQHINNAHEGTIRSIIQLKNGYLASCSKDNTIKIWKPKIVTSEIIENQLIPPFQKDKQACIIS